MKPVGPLFVRHRQVQIYFRGRIYFFVNHFLIITPENPQRKGAGREKIFELRSAIWMVTKNTEMNALVNERHSFVAFVGKLRGAPNYANKSGGVERDAKTEWINSRKNQSAR
jgi:hypothetical protein